MLPFDREDDLLPGALEAHGARERRHLVLGIALITLVLGGVLTVVARDDPESRSLALATRPPLDQGVPRTLSPSPIIGVYTAPTTPVTALGTTTSPAKPRSPTSAATEAPTTVTPAPSTSSSAQPGSLAISDPELTANEIDDFDPYCPDHPAYVIITVRVTTGVAERVRLAIEPGGHAREMSGGRGIFRTTIPGAELGSGSYSVRATAEGQGLIATSGPVSLVVHHCSDTTP